MTSSGKCTGLQSLLTDGNDYDGSAEWHNVVKSLQLLRTEAQSEDPKARQPLLSHWFSRNKRVLSITRSTSLRQLCQARILFSGNPTPALELVHDENISERVLSTPSTYSPREQPPSTLRSHFPFLQLPPELQLHIFSLTFLTDNSSPVFECAKMDGRLPSLSESELAPELTESQISKVLAYAMDRGTLAKECAKDDVLMSMDCYRFQRG